MALSRPPRATLSTLAGFCDLYLQGLRVSLNHLLPSLRYLMCACVRVCVCYVCAHVHTCVGSVHMHVCESCAYACRLPRYPVEGMGQMEWRPCLCPWSVSPHVCRTVCTVALCPLGSESYFNSSILLEVTWCPSFLKDI